MRITTVIAIALIVLGIAAFGYQGISYTTREKVVDIGPLEMTAEKTRTLPLPQSREVLHSQAESCCC